MPVALLNSREVQGSKPSFVDKVTCMRKNLPETMCNVVLRD